jgi:RNA polymerase sigma-70 factor (ECF subfamily)
MSSVVASGRLGSAREVADGGTLADLLAAGRVDDLAFAEMYDRTSRLVFLTVQRVLRDHAQADEVVQEVYLQAWEKAASYRGELASVTSWLLVIARARAVDRVRASESAKARDLDEWRRSARLAGDPPEHEALQRIEVRRLRAALAELSEPQRQAIVLSHLAGYSHAEIAGLLGVPVGTVKSRIRQGLHVLRRGLERRASPR